MAEYVPVLRRDLNREMEWSEMDQNLENIPIVFVSKSALSSPSSTVSVGGVPASDVALATNQIKNGIPHANLSSKDAPNSHPISAITGLQTSLDGKQSALISGTNIKTINGNSILGSGNLEIVGTGGGGGEGGVTDHNLLNNRGLDDAHPISAITDLQSSLDTLQNQLNIKLEDIQAGTNVSIDRTNPLKPIISFSTVPDEPDEPLNPQTATVSYFVFSGNLFIDGVTGLLLEQMQIAVGTNLKVVSTTPAVDHTSVVDSITPYGTQGLFTIKLNTAPSGLSGSTSNVIATITNLDIPESGGGGVPTDHNSLTNRTAPNSHPISAITGLQTALDGKQPNLVSSQNIKTINGGSILGSGNLEISAGSASGINFFNKQKSLKIELFRLNNVGFPNGIFIDEQNNDIYVGYARGSATNTTFARYNFTTGQLLQSFTAGASNYPEGFAVYTEGSTKILITRTSSASYGAIGKYDITSVSVSGGNAPLLSQSSDIGAYYQMAFDGNWLYVEGGSNVGAVIDRSAISIYDLNFNYVGQMRVNPSLLGDNDRPVLPKRQTFTVLNGNIIAGVGGAVATGTADSIIRYQGVVVLDGSGNVVSSQLSPHDRFLQKLNSFPEKTYNGVYSENEGVCATPSGKVYSMWVTGGAGNNSIKVLEEFSTSSNSLDFSDTIRFIPFIPVVDNYFPNRQRDLVMRKVIGNTPINDLRDIFLEMLQLSCRTFQFFYDHFTINLSLPSSPNLTGAFVRITNCNNAVGVVEVIGINYTKTYYVSNTIAGTLNVIAVN